MFSQKIEPTPQELTEILFRKLHNSGKFAVPAKNVFNIGKELLETKNLAQIEVDKIILGTLLLAFSQHDFRYQFAGSVPKQLDPEIKQSLIEGGLDLFGNVDSISTAYKKEHILSLGKMILEDKTIAFKGIFSQVEEIQKMIIQALPFMTSDYLKTTYDIKFGGPANKG